MMFTLSERRKKWDPNFSKCDFPLGGSHQDDDVVASATMDFGYLTNLVMFQSSKGITLTSRNWRRWDAPKPGNQLMSTSQLISNTQYLMK